MATDTTPTELVDDEHKRDARGHRIAEPKRKADIIAGYAGSGMTQKAYARREGINYHTLVSWLSQSRRHAASAGTTAPGEAHAPRFAQLSWPPAATSASRLEVVLPEGAILRGDDPAAMLILLRELAPRRPC